MKAELGDLDKVTRIVKVLGMVNATPEFGHQPEVINGCSDLFVEVFGERGKHARSAVGLGSLPSCFVETAIALSVVAAALNNLLRTIDARWAVAFALGLLHGFGFSSVLIDLGLPSQELIGALLGFNVGVELGQAAIVLVAIPVLFLIRRTLAYQALLWAGSASVVLVASVWSYQRCFI